MVTLGKIIDVNRHQANMSVDELADSVGAGRKTVRKWIQGESVPKDDSLLKIAGLFGLSIEMLEEARKAAEETIEATELYRKAIGRVRNMTLEEVREFMKEEDVSQ